MKQIKQRSAGEMEIVKAFLDDYDLYGDAETYTILKQHIDDQLNNKEVKNGKATDN